MSDPASIISTVLDPSIKVLIRLRELHKIYDTGGTAVHALRGLNVDIPEGQFIAIMGASGSGKSTLLNLLGALDVPSQGDYVLAGQATSKMTRDQLAQLRNTYIGFIFQNFNLLNRSTALENVELPMVYAGKPTHTRREAAMNALTKVDLADRTHHLPSQLSGGQQQRVAIARALAIDPLVLLMDEPLSNLDAQLRRQMRVELRRLQRQVGITTIFVTHDQEEALTLSDRLVVMNRGRIEQAGTPIELYRRPRTPFVAQFLGHPNFLFGTVAERRGNEVTVQMGAQQVHAVYDSPVERGAPVAVVLRAESAALHKAAPPARVNALRGTIAYAVYLGTSSEYEVTLADGLRLRVIEQMASGLPSFAEGEDVVVSWAPEDSIVLPGSRESMPDLVS
jgi:ABC-type Fe3+/spermidine/putrescine transport system ATPase subunit